MFAPNSYSVNTFYFSEWEKFVLKNIPLSTPMAIVKLLINPLANKLSKKINKGRTKSMARLSDAQISYITHQMHSFKNKTNILFNFYKDSKYTMPTFLLDNNISCSIAQRSVIKKCLLTGKEDGIEIDLYNWKYLATSDLAGFPVTKKIVSEYVNIPTYSHWFK